MDSETKQKKQRLTVSSLLSAHVLNKPRFKDMKEGRCYLCMRETQVVPAKQVVSGNFTGFQYLKAGDGICLECATALKEASFRKTNWIVSETYLETFKYTEFYDKLVEFIQIGAPFAVSITKSFKKHNWILDPYGVNFPPKDLTKALTTTRYTVFFEEDIVKFTFPQLERLREIALKLVQVFGKQRLETLEANPHTIEVLIELSLMSEYQEALRHKKQPLWELVVKTIESPKKLITMKALKKERKKAKDVRGKGVSKQFQGEVKEGNVKQSAERSLADYF